MAPRFNLRVYGIVLNEAHEVLLSHESRNGFRFTKFPGGGLEFGEGLLDALRREFMEELGVEIKKSTFFYVNEFFQPSAFNPSDQLISFYYLVTVNIQEINPELILKPSNLLNSDDYEVYNWYDLKGLTSEFLTFPIDQKVLIEIQEKLLKI